MKYILTILFFLFISLESNVYGQNNIQEFSTITIMAKTSYRLHENVINSEWSSSYGLELYSEMPFYAGQIGLGLHFVPFNSNTENPDFNIYSFYLSWGSSLRISNSISFFIGIKAGAAFFSFASSELTQYERLESELSLGANSRFSYYLNSNLGLNLELAYVKYFTNYQIKQLSALAGIEYKFSTSKWFRDFFN